MFALVLSGFIVSVDAFFIGLSVGLQEKVRYTYIILMNAALALFCFFGFFIAAQIYDMIPFDPDVLVGTAFITLGLWIIFHNFIINRKNRREGDVGGYSKKTLVLIGFIMSVEAMLITVGVTLVFHDIPVAERILAPLTIAAAHFIYSSISFFLVRTKYIKKMPLVIGQVISGSALILYGLLALV
ncbi:MAG: hypothetical protein FWC95_01645 [Defluviitaleaceae bacterium]|nr:hypothetical protein [Defluviitaleaceae bacterium]